MMAQGAKAEEKAEEEADTQAELNALQADKKAAMDQKEALYAEGPVTLSDDKDDVDVIDHDAPAFATEQEAVMASDAMLDELEAEDTDKPIMMEDVSNGLRETTKAVLASESAPVADQFSGYEAEASANGHAVADPEASPEAASLGADFVKVEDLVDAEMFDEEPVDEPEGVIDATDEVTEEEAIRASDTAA